MPMMLPSAANWNASGAAWECQAEMAPL